MNKDSKILIKKCPFCGKLPFYDSKTKNVRCETLDCAIHSWWINVEEWNKRTVNLG